MKVFISSVISGFEEFRDAADAGISALGHEILRAENFSSSDASPRIACLDGVRKSDIVVLLLGERYGDPLLPTSLAPTHEEYREAKNEKPVLVFVQSSVEFEDLQRKFIDEVQSWDQGKFRVAFSSADDLQAKVTRALHDYELSVATTPINTVDLLSAAEELLKDSDGNYYSSRGPQLRVAIVGGPARQILRPAEIEEAGLGEKISQLCLFGDGAVFDMSSGTEISNSDDALILRQENGSYFRLNESGQISIGANLQTSKDGFPVLIEESVQESFCKIFRVSSAVLDEIDSSHKISRLVMSTKMEGGDYVAWRKRDEIDSNATSMINGHSFAGERSGSIHLSPPDFLRATLRNDAQKMAEDLTTVMRRRQR